ncbi:MAG: helix-turn-helix domain-containing protein [Pseudomonadota bacterium]
MALEIEQLHKLTAHLPVVLKFSDVMREGNCSKSTVERAIKANQLVSFKRGKARLFTKQAFIDWLAQDHAKQADEGQPAGADA